MRVRAFVLACVLAQHKGTALEFSAAVKEEEFRRQCRMAFARVDFQKQNFERRMKKQVVRRNVGGASEGQPPPCSPLCRGSTVWAERAFVALWSPVRLCNRDRRGSACFCATTEADAFVMR